MILRRFMKHVTDQNWFAVGLDVIVVIVGIFLGLQVSNWAEDRTQQEQENMYLERLHSELSDVIVKLGRYTGGQKLVSQNLSELASFVVNNDLDVKLTIQHCNALNMSHIYVSPAVALPTMTELLASGQLSILQNQNLRLLISRYILAENQATDLIDNLRGDKLDLARKHPEIILLSPSSGELDLALDRKIVCDYDAMRESRSFRNDLVGNNRRYKGFMEALSGQIILISEMHNELDKVLSISH